MVWIHQTTCSLKTGVMVKARCSFTFICAGYAHSMQQRKQTKTSKSILFNSWYMDVLLVANHFMLSALKHFTTNMHCKWMWLLHTALNMSKRRNWTQWSQNIVLLQDLKLPDIKVEKHTLFWCALLHKNCCSGIGVTVFVSYVVSLCVWVQPTNPKAHAGIGMRVCLLRWPNLKWVII